MRAVITCICTAFDREPSKLAIQFEQPSVYSVHGWLLENGAHVAHPLSDIDSLLSRPVETSSTSEAGWP
jgi:hypothetical protein